MKHIIDTDELEKLPKYAWSDVGAVPCNRGDGKPPHLCVCSADEIIAQALAKVKGK